MKTIDARKFGITLSIALASAAAAADAPRFEIKPAASYAAHQTNDGVTIGVLVHETAEECKAPFGKLNPNEHGLLPVLVVIHNASKQALKIDKMRVAFVTSNRDRIEPTPAADAPYLEGPNRPKPVYGPTGGVKVKRKKNPFKDGQLDQREFTAKMIPPGETVSGFFYFQTGVRPGSQLYLTGIREAASGKEVFYFEIPL